MEEYLGLRNSLDVEIQAYITSLVSALGGRGADEDGRYVLGDDAIACLKDIRRWLRLYDEKTNRLDVARCLAEANVVKGDLLEILSLWREDTQNDRYLAKLALACLELLVPLTWPLDKSDDQMTVNHHRHMPYLQDAQIWYKQEILQHEQAKILRTVIRIGLPSMAVPLSERSNRDHGIIKLILYFIRNLAIISLPPNLQGTEDESQVSRAATIEAFHYQDIFHLLLTIGSGIKEDFDQEDMVVLEILYHILKGVDPDRLFQSDHQKEHRKADELEALLKKEAAMVRSYTKNRPTRHSRFGTMIWIKRGNDRVSTVCGQDVLRDDYRGLAKMDESKKWKKPKSGRKKAEDRKNDADVNVTLTRSAEKHLRLFVAEFLDSAFNPLFFHAHRAIEREEDRVLRGHSRQFFYLVSWFLKADRARRKAARESRRPSNDADADADSSPFALIASVLTQEVFITLNRFMQTSYDEHEWQDLKSGMRCFTQILLTVQEMSESALEDDQSIAENILSRLFYEETTHERIVGIVRYYNNQDFGYLDACTELAHVHLRVLEAYSKQNVEMQVRARRSIRKRKKKAVETTTTNNETEKDVHQAADVEGVERDDDDTARAEQTSVERRFDFTRFATKFMKQGCIDTFVAFTRYYQELNPEQLKRTHRFFYRVAFKSELSVMLYRVDIIQLLNKMIKGPESLDMHSHEGKQWEELVRQLFKKMIRIIEKRPQMIVELLFSKIPGTVHFLEHGFVKQTTTSRKPRVPAELEIKPGVEEDRHIGIVVVVLQQQNQHDALQWVKKVLMDAFNERYQLEAEHAVRLAEGGDESASVFECPPIDVKPDNQARREAMFKNNKLRLLMTLVGFERIGTNEDTEAKWIIPSSISTEDLQKAHKAIEVAETTPPIFEEGQKAEDFIRRKPTPRVLRRGQFDDESEGDDDFIVIGGRDGDGNGDDGDGLEAEEEGGLFPPDAPSRKRKSDALEEIKRKRRSRQQKEADGGGEVLTETELDEKRKARLEANRKKLLKIKSDLFVHESDDEENEQRDQDFFAKEEERRRKQGFKVLEALEKGVIVLGDNDDEGEEDDGEDGENGRQRGATGSKKRKSKSTKGTTTSKIASRKRRKGSSSSSQMLLDEDEDDDGMAVNLDGSNASSPAAVPQQKQLSEMFDTPQEQSKPGSSSSEQMARKKSGESASVPVNLVGDEDEDEEEEDVIPVRRRRLIGPFVEDDDDSDE
ncbi:MAG: Topoisomerase 1-associated factor 1 [Watsoniomyces obsoletus]|nr:MAG: Topoisomerase 1-associated factor 1 [Watsoniomyces obsoletus]